MNIKKQLVTAALIAAPLVSFNAMAVPMEVEGPITSIVDNGDGSGTVTVMGMAIFVPAGTPINSPTASMTMSQLADPTPLAGRSKPGFIGGTAIILGDTVTGAEDVFVEPAENVVLGELTANCMLGCADGNGVMEYYLALNGMKMVPNTDSRIPFIEAIDPNALVISLESAQVNQPAAAEGYYGEDNVFHFFALEAMGEPAAGRGANAISISRAQCRNGREIRVQGGVFDADGVIEAAVQIEGFGNAAVALDPLTGELTYQLRVGINGNCPAQVTATYAETLDSTVSATADFEIR